MIDPLTAAPVSAQHAAAHAPDHKTAESAREYTSQAEAVAASIQANMADAAGYIRKALGNPGLLGDGQFTSELDSRIDFLDQVSEILAGRGIDRRAKLMRQGELGDDEREAMKLIKEVAGDLDLASQVVTLRRALGLLGPRPGPEVDPEQVAMLAFIRSKVAPKRDADSLLPLVGLDGGSLLGDLAQLLALDEGGGEAVELADFVPASFVEAVADA